MEFLEFLNKSVSPWHTVDCLRRCFLAASFEELDLSAGRVAKLGSSYFFVRGGAIVALRMPKQMNRSSRFRLALAHTDFPALKISPNPDRMAAGVCTLHTEVYGSPLFTSWLDRDLGFAGVLAYEKGGQVRSKLVRGEKLFRIPELAVHLNRGVNQEGLKVNPQVDFNVLWRSAAVSENGSACGNAFVDALQNGLAEGERLLDFDVQLFDAQSAALGGLEDEWVFSGRLDNLSSCHAMVSALTDSPACENDFCVACFCNNEEVGSETREGACGNFVRTVLEYVWNSAWQQTSAGAAPALVNLSSILAESFALSIDMAHAVHPNHPEKHESKHAPVLGGGIVLKTNAQKRYASDALSSAKLKLLCEKAGSPLQTFVMRSDMPCGSTVGPAISSSLGIPTVDIGEPMLSMHSIREMTAVKDHGYMIRVICALYENG